MQLKVVKHSSKDSSRRSPQLASRLSNGQSPSCRDTHLRSAHQGRRPSAPQRPTRHRRTAQGAVAYRKRRRRSTPLIKLRNMMLEALLWVIGAIAIRLILNGIMAASSQFWLLSVVVACLPAVTAVWMTYLSPRQGFILGYRCLLVMTGLLLGGKLDGSS